MNLRDLEYIASVATHEAFGKAAKACRVSQPTLSMQIKKVERELGLAIFERDNKRVWITAEGKRLLERIRRILQDVEELTQEARSLRDPYAGEIRLGVFPTLSAYFLPKLVPLLSKAYPKLQLLLVEEKTQSLLQKLQAGELDVIFLAYPHPADKVISVPLFEDPFYLAVPRGHPLSGKKNLDLKELHGERLLLLEEGHCLRHQALSVCNRSGAQEKENFRATSLETLRQMVASGSGITLIPKMAVRETDKNVDYLSFKTPPSRTIGLFWRPTSPRTLLLEGIRDLIRREFGLEKKRG